MFLNNTDNKSGFPICRFSKEYIYVQRPTPIENMNNFSDSITLHIMNNYSDKLDFRNKRLLSANEINKKFCKDEQLDEDTSAIHIQIPIGSVNEAFVDGESYKNFDMIVPSSDWSVSQWEKNLRGDCVNCSITASTSKMELKEYECISIGISKIASFCVPGSTYVKIYVENVANVTELYKSFNLMKRPASLSIIRFDAGKYVISQGENARLTWKTAEKTNGKILSREFCISSGVSEYNEKIMNTKTYTLAIENEHKSCKSFCTVYVSPPIIRAFSLELQPSQINATWKTEYSSVTTLNGETCESTGSKVFSKEEKAIILSCDGYLYHIEKTLFPKYLSDVMLECTRLIFKYYTVIQVNWNPKQSIDCKLLIQEPENHYVTDLSKGSFEYVYLHPAKHPMSNNCLRMCFVDKTSSEVELYKSRNWKYKNNSKIELR